MTETRRRILEAAIELLLADSYHKVSIDRIAEHAGVSKGGLFHHFGSKIQLASEALVFAFDEMWAEAFAELDAIADPRARLRRLIDFSLASGPETTRLMRTTLEVIDERVREGHDGEELAESLAGFEAPIARWLAECGASDPALDATILLAALDGLAAQAALLGAEGRALDVEALGERVYELFAGDPGSQDPASQHPASHEGSSHEGYAPQGEERG